MADTQGQADIRGIDIDKVAKGFAELDLKFKRIVTITNTSAREIRWYQKTSGFLTATSPAVITNVSHGTRPFILEQSWTRNTSYVRKYFVESPVISMEDLSDSDPDILAGNIRDLTRAVAYQVDARIYAVISENQTPVNINSNATNAAWNAASYTGVNIVEDLLEAKMNIYNDGYDPEGAILLLSPLDHKSLLTWLIDGKGSSIPAFASSRITDGIVQEILGLRVMVSPQVVADSALVIVPQQAATWKSFMPITARQIEDVGIGIKIRVWEEGECILHDPAAVNILTNTQA